MNLQKAQEILKITNNSYEKIASDFSDTRNRSWQETDLVISKHIKDNFKILDLGCGNARLLKSLQKNNFKNLDYTGLDNSNKFIKKNQDSKFQIPNSKFLNIKFIKGDILNLKHFKNNEFNTVFMIAIFNHIPSEQLRQKVLNEIYRILKPNGKLIMTNWNLWNVKNKKSIWKYNLKLSFPELGKLSFRDVITLWQNKYPLYYRAFTLRELKKLFKKSNFKILENKYVKDGKPAHWWNGKNILTIGEK
ncbi:class I SAM-dependent methyltransferase [Patescibacteria group bacterium]